MQEDPAANRLPRGKRKAVVQADAGSTATDRPVAIGDDRPVAMVVDRPVPIGEDRSPNAWVCPFLRASDENDVLGLPIEAPDPANRCAALPEPVPQSLRQQELVCLTSGHVNCPRYLRGSMLPVEPVERTPGSATLTPATAGALAVFALASLISVGFVIGNGGLVLTAAPGTGTSGGVLGNVETRVPTAAATVVPTLAATPVPTPTAVPTPSPAPTPSPTPTATPSPTPSATPTPTPTARPKSSRYALLTPCPNTPNCYIYVIRSGDNLYSIANYFGVSQARVEAMNPWVSNGLVVGRDLRIPTPTR